MRKRKKRITFTQKAIIQPSIVLSIRQRRILLSVRWQIPAIHPSIHLSIHVHPWFYFLLVFVRYYIVYEKKKIQKWKMKMRHSTPLSNVTLLLLFSVSTDFWLVDKKKNKKKTVSFISTAILVCSFCLFLFVPGRYDYKVHQDDVATVYSIYTPPGRPPPCCVTTTQLCLELSVFLCLDCYYIVYMNNNHRQILKVKCFFPCFFFLF